MSIPGIQYRILLSSLKHVSTSGVRSQESGVRTGVITVKFLVNFKHDLVISNLYRLAPHGGVIQKNDWLHFKLRKTTIIHLNPDKLVEFVHISK